jgi:hypothetical protein
MHLQDWEYLRDYPEGLEDITPRQLLRDNNYAHMDAYHEIYTSEGHACHPAHLGHDPRQKF